MKKICILIPIYNEEPVLPLLKSHLLQVCDGLPYQFRFLMVNDGSSDQSLAMLRAMHKEDPRFCYLNLSRNFGKESALLAGMDYFDEDALILMDADLQDPPELIPQLIAAWEEGYDDVYARRTSRQGESFLKKATAHCYYRVLQHLSSVPIQADTGDFRLLDRRCVNALRSLRESGRCTKSLFSWIGYRKKEIPFQRQPRAAGKTKWNYPKLFDLALDGITALSTKPLRLVSLFGILLGIGVPVCLLLALCSTLFGWGLNALALCAVGLVLALFAIQFLAIGLLGEYIGRMFQQSKGRPLYLVDCYNERKEENVPTDPCQRATDPDCFRSQMAPPDNSDSHSPGVPGGSLFQGRLVR